MVTEPHMPGAECVGVAECTHCTRPIYCCDDGMNDSGEPAHVDCALSVHEMTDCEV